jgi:SAM-dependent methyltransferase
MVLHTAIVKLRKLISDKYFGLAGLPSLDEEVAPELPYLKGLVFNAGAGHRPVRVKHDYITCDFDETAPVDFLCDLHYIPLMDQCVDSIITIAVLEHTRYPWLVVQEFSRILKPGGVVVFCVPFLQPEHAVPHDFYRYTVYGVQALLSSAGFQIVRQRRLSRFHRGIGWMLQERWKNERGILAYLKAFVINQVSRRSKDTEPGLFSVYTGSYTIAEKMPGTWVPPATKPASTQPHWFRHLLVDPVSKEPLRWTTEDRCENAQGKVYTKIEGKIDFRPQDGQSQDSEVKWGNNHDLVTKA